MDGRNKLRVAIKYSRFEDGREMVDDKERSGCPKSTQTEVNAADVADLVKNFQQISSRMIAEYLNKDCSSSDSEREYAKEKVVCTIFSTLLDT
jgi:hypothetical protein